MARKSKKEKKPLAVSTQRDKEKWRDQHTRHRKFATRKKFFCWRAAGNGGRRSPVHGGPIGHRSRVLNVALASRTKYTAVL